MSHLFNFSLTRIFETAIIIAPKIITNAADKSSTPCKPIKTYKPINAEKIPVTFLRVNFSSSVKCARIAVHSGAV